MSVQSVSLKRDASWSAVPRETNTAQALAHKINQYLLSKNPFKSGSSLKRELASLSFQQLNTVLELTFREIALSGKSVKRCEKLTTLLPPDQLQLARELKTAKELLWQARYILRTTAQPLGPSFHARLTAAADLLISLIENVLSGFGIADFFAHAGSTTEANMKSQKIMMLLHLSTLLVTIIGASAAGPVGWTLLSIAGFSIVFPHIKPPPSKIYKGINWTKQYRQGQLHASTGRKKSLDEIAHTLLASTKVKTHPLLIGKSGVGKTEAAKAFVQAIEQGDYPQLKGKRVFYFNTANLVKSVGMFQNENKILSKINEEIGRHRNNMILIFDEIHLACQKDNRIFGEQLKTLLDPGSSNLPYVIGITTEEEYYRDIYVNNAAFARRFKRINIENPNPAEELSILSNTLLRQAPHLILENGALQALQAKTKAAFPESPEPISSLKILSRCIQKTGELQNTSLEDKVEQVRMRIESLHSQNGPFIAAQNGEELQTLENELAQLEKALEEKQQELTHFHRHRENLAETKKSTLQTILNISLAQKKALPKKQLATFSLLNRFLIPAQERIVREEAARLGVKTTFDIPLIDQVIQEELDNEKKTQLAIERGKNQLRERKGLKLTKK